MSGLKSNEPDDQLLDEFLAGQGAVRETYLATAQEQAPAHLDAAVLRDAAQAAARPVQRLRRPRWQAPMAAAAVMVLSFGVFLQVQRDPAAQKELSAAPERPAPSVAAAESETSLDATQAEPQTDAVTTRAEVDTEKKQAAAVATTPKPAPSAGKRRAAPADDTPPPAPPPAMARALAPAAPLGSTESEAAPMAADAATSSAATGAMAQESMRRQEQFAAAAAPKAKASRSLAGAAALSAPVMAPPGQEALADAQSATQRMDCPELKPGQVPAVTTAAAAIAVAKPVLIQRFTAELIASVEPLQGERRGQRWQVFGTLAAGVVGGTPEAEVCASTGAVLSIYHTQ